MNTLNFEQAAQRLATFAAAGQRVIVGLVGAPGAGKSTWAAKLQATLPHESQILPMDGFHLSNAELLRLGRRERKGAPDTFDSAGYVALLKRLRNQAPSEVVYAPNFDRSTDQSVASSLPVFGHNQVIIAEGNYLAYDQHGWGDVLALLSEVWFVDIEPALRVKRLIARHIEFGKTPAFAAQWEQQTDAPNAQLIEATRHRAQFILR